jgi:hypothetical protein
MSISQRHGGEQTHHCVAEDVTSAQRDEYQKTIIPKHKPNPFELQPDMPANDALMRSTTDTAK